MIKQFKINNPKRSDQSIKQVISISDKLEYDYNDSTWIGIDTEFLSYNLTIDRLCVIQIASADPDDKDKLRIEIIHVYKKAPDKKLISLLLDRNIEKIFHVFQSDMPRIEKYIGEKILGDIFDTKIAAKLTLTNLESYSMQTLIKYLIDPKFAEKKQTTSSEWDLEPVMWEEDQFQYASEDVLYLHELKQRILRIAKRRDRTKLVKDTMLILPTISELIGKGFTHNIFGY